MEMKREAKVVDSITLEAGDVGSLSELRVAKRRGCGGGCSPPYDARLPRQIPKE